MAYFCTRTGARILAPGTVDTVLEHDGSDAADVAEHAARAFIQRSHEQAKIGTVTDRPAPEPSLAEAAAKVAADAFKAAKAPAAKPGGKSSDK
jgi:hypothetical protein